MEHPFAALGVAAALVLSPTACQASDGGRGGVAPASQPARATDPTAQDYRVPPLPRAKVVLKDAYGGSQAVDVEVASSGISRQRGMMWRTSLAAGKGMLFIFPEEEVHSFWMKNTLIPLDMIFISRDRRIAGIVHQAAPRTMDLKTVNKPSLYVLEVPGGWAEKTGVQAGSTVEMEGISAISVQP